jgi:hypothetical protein
MKQSLLCAFLFVLLGAGAVDLDTFYHGGSTVRPLAGTTKSAESATMPNFDAHSRTSQDELLDGAFDAASVFSAEAALQGKFSSFEPKGMFILIR